MNSLPRLTPCQSSGARNFDAFTLQEHLHAAASLSLAARPRARSGLEFVPRGRRGPCSRQELSDIIDAALSLLEDDNDDFMLGESFRKPSDDNNSGSNNRSSLPPPRGSSLQ